MNSLSVKSVTNRHGHVVTLEETGKGHIKVWGNGVTLSKGEAIQLRDWLNEQYPTQPPVAEPVAPIGYVSKQAITDLGNGSICTITPGKMLDDGQGWEVPVYAAAPLPAGEPIYQWLEGGTWVDVSRQMAASMEDVGFRTRIVYLAPPAAVLKDAERYRYLRDMTEGLDTTVDAMIAEDAAMRAQAGNKEVL